jgi:predicted ATP-dependent endonuclease of OLD family
LRKLFKRDIDMNWENSQLKVRFSAEGAGSRMYSAGREASGLLHLAGLLAAIYNDEIGMLLLDEPEVSLHPQLQAFLLREMAAVAGIPGEGNKKLIVISTHSTEFLKIESAADLPNLVFMSDIKLPPTQIDPDAGELKNKKISELISRMGQEHKLSFFAQSPLLVEGPSDTVICAGLSSKLDIHLEAGGSQILPVIGKGQFPVVVKLLRLMGKTPFVLADADAFTDSNELVSAFASDPLADAEAVKRSHTNFAKMFAAVYGDFATAVEVEWESIKPLAAKMHEGWWTRAQAVDLM